MDRRREAEGRHDAPQKSLLRSFCVEVLERALEVQAERRLGVAAAAPGVAERVEEARTGLGGRVGRHMTLMCSEPFRGTGDAATGRFGLCVSGELWRVIVVLLMYGETPECRERRC